MFGMLRLRRYLTLSVLLPALCLAARPLHAQSATAVPKLDLDKLTGTWYQVARLPTRAEKKCLADGTVLYALNDKPRTFQVATFCTVKGGDKDDLGNSGQQDKLGTGFQGGTMSCQLRDRFWTRIVCWRHYDIVCRNRVELSNRPPHTPLHCAHCLCCKDHVC